ncbi:hypothetical protein RhiirC2_855883 [Rhizophagus irregularis]|uniref:HMG box domain-containing protein n=1 Tax=Rhizophagus irregularis TaxID=588596 RepID=A0A2N1MKF5_9GLOM|nr:hypothetical protein RhiirC2_855883 [Rhizophagus irregularis]
MIEESNNIEHETEINSLSENSGLSEEALSLIEEMRLKHEAEINCLSKKLKLNPEFIKDIMQYQRGHAIQKKRKISAYNLFQMDWWKNKTNDYNLSTANVQKICADDWKKLEENDYKFYQEQANEITNNQKLNPTKFIENAKSRSTVLNKGILNIKRIFNSLQITCGQEFITLTVSNNNELNSNYFGSNVGEEFYRNSSKFRDFVAPFRSFSVVKYNEHIGILDKVEKSFQNQDLLLEAENNKNVEIDIDINKVNSKDVRNNVRKLLKSKFEKDVNGTTIPYKNWITQKKYAIENWPDDVIFQDYGNIKNEKDRKKVLLALKDIKFVRLD